MLMRRAVYLLKTLNLKVSEIEPPDGGWSRINIPCFLDYKSDKFGRIFIIDSGYINYMTSGFSILDVKNYHKSLIEIAVEQLENKARYFFATDLKFNRFPDLYHLLMKFHALY